MLAEVLQKVLTDEVAAEVTAKLPQFRGRPAVVMPPLPSDLPLPAIVIAEGGGQTWGTGNRPGTIATLEVKVIGGKNATGSDVRDLAWRVWGHLDRRSLEPYMSSAGLENWGCVADPPMEVAEESELAAYSIRVTIRVLRAAKGGAGAGGPSPSA